MAWCCTQRDDRTGRRFPRRSCSPSAQAVGKAKSLAECPELILHGDGHLREERGLQLVTLEVIQHRRTGAIGRTGLGWRRCAGWAGDASRGSHCSPGSRSAFPHDDGAGSAQASRPSLDPWSANRLTTDTPRTATSSTASKSHTPSVYSLG